jgi:hypothetical protein
MAPDTAALIRDGLALDADRRAVVANAVLESFHGAGEAGEVDAAWQRRDQPGRRAVVPCQRPGSALTYFVTA